MKKLSFLWKKVTSEWIEPRQNGGIPRIGRFELTWSERAVKKVDKKQNPYTRCPACPRRVFFFGNNNFNKSICASQQCSSSHSMRGSSSYRIGCACPRLSSGCSACLDSSRLHEFHFDELVLKLLRNLAFILIYNPLLLLLIMFC